MRSIKDPTSSTLVRPAVIDRNANIARARRIVVKIGTSVVTENGAVAFARLASLLATVAGLRAAGREVTVVSSGAVGLGRSAFDLETARCEGSIRQACAAIGNAQLAAAYRRAFCGFDLLPAQVLVSQGDFDDRSRALRLRDALELLLSRGTVPVINENDAVARDALASVSAPHVFDDNDRLAALVAAALGADLLVLLTDVDGVYTSDPRVDPRARPIDRVDDESSLGKLGGPASDLSRGGMRAKVRSAQLAQDAGCHVVIASGLRPGGFSHVVAGDHVGTWFPARERPHARRRWIAFATAPRGVLHLDAGAVDALRARGASLLAAGVRRIDGRWRPGEVVELRDDAGALVGRARLRHGSTTLRRLCRRDGPGHRGSPLVARRDAIVFEPTSIEALSARSPSLEPSP